MSSLSLWQGAHVKAAFLNEVCKAGITVNRQPDNHRCRSNSSAVFKYCKSQIEIVSSESRRRGRPKKNAVRPDGLSGKNSETHIPSANSQPGSSPPTRNYKGHLFKYTEVVPNVLFEQFQDEEHVSKAIAAHISRISRESIDSRGWFTIALSGGSLVKILQRLTEEADIEWTKWHVLWVDERVVPLIDNDSNFKAAMDTFLSRSKMPKDQIHPIKYTADANVVAKRYEQLMRDLVKRKVLRLDVSRTFPSFDMILLGIGPDGHVASLFPNSIALAEENEWVVAVLRSPKPPAGRISMSLPCINAARHVAFVVVGSSKSEVVQRVLERPALPGSLPAQMVRPSEGVVHWFVDKAAASNLHIDAWEDPKLFPGLNYSVAKTR